MENVKDKDARIAFLEKENETLKKTVKIQTQTITRLIKHFILKQK